MSFLTRGKAFASTAVSAAAAAKNSASAAASGAAVSASSAASRARNTMRDAADKAKSSAATRAPLLAEVAEDAKNASCTAAAAARSSTSNVAAKARGVGYPSAAPPGPTPRIVFGAVSRNDQILAEAVPSGPAPSGPGDDGTDEVSARYLGQKMMRRKAPPGWDELNGGKLRSIRMPIHDSLGVTCYTICFTTTLPGDRAQSVVQKLALMLEPLIEKSAGGQQDRHKVESALLPVLQRELDNANTGLKQFQIENQVSEVRQIMLQNVEVMLDRQDRLNDLEQKSSNFEGAARTFQSGSRRLRRFHLMNQVKWGVAIGTGVTLAAAAVVVPIAVAVA